MEVWVNGEVRKLSFVASDFQEWAYEIVGDMAVEDEEGELHMSEEVYDEARAVLLLAELTDALVENGEDEDMLDFYDAYWRKERSTGNTLYDYARQYVLACDVAKEIRSAA